MQLYFFIFVLTLVWIVGILVSYRLFKTSNKMLLIGSGAIMGILGLLLFLGTLSYIIKGSLGIYVIFFGYLFLGLLSGVKFYPSIYKLFVNTSKKSLIYLSPCLIYIILIFLYTNSFALSGDSDLWFEIETSFARGNYPVVLSHQPDYLTVYHTGAFLVGGALYAVSGLNILAVHTLLSAYIAMGVFLILIGMAREFNRTALCFIPAIFGMIIFSTPLFLIKGQISFIFETLNLFVFLKFKELILYLVASPLVVDLKGAMSGGSMSFIDFITRFFYNFGFAALLLFLNYGFIYKWKESLYKKYILLGILTGLTVSLNETFFIVELFLLVFLFLLDIRKFYGWSFLKIPIITGLSILLIVSLVQNNIRDSFLTPNYEIPRFKIILPGLNQKIVYPDYAGIYRYVSNKTFDHDSLSSIMAKMTFMSSLTVQRNNTIWYLPDLLIIIAILSVASIILRSKILGAISLASAISVPMSGMLINTFFPDSSYRFIHQSSHFATLGLGFLILIIFNKIKFFKPLFFITFLFLFLPSILISHARIIDGVFFGPNAANFGQQGIWHAKLFSRIQKYVPSNKRILLMDKYPFESRTSYATSIGLTQFGFLIPISPVNVKVLNNDGGAEWYDAMATLDPVALKKLGVDYVFIFNEHRNFFSENRIKQLQNPIYFNPLFIDDEGVLYKVQSQYKLLNSDETTLELISKRIPSGKKVYIDNFSDQAVEIRKGLAVNLAKRVKLVGPDHLSYGGDYFIYIESVLPFHAICKPAACGSDIDFAITKTNVDPNKTLTGSFNKVLEMKQVILWERSN